MTMNVPHIQITSVVKAVSVSSDASAQECTFNFEEDVDRWDSSVGGELLEEFPMRFDDSFEEKPTNTLVRPTRFGSMVRSLSSRSIEVSSQASTNSSAPPARGLPQKSQSMRWSFRWRKRKSATTRFDGEEVKTGSSGKNVQDDLVASVAVDDKPCEDEQTPGESPSESRHETNTPAASTGNDVSKECRSNLITPQSAYEPDASKTASGEDPIAKLMAKLKSNADDQETNKPDTQWEFPSLLYDGEEEEEPNLDAQLSRVIALVR